MARGLMTFLVCSIDMYDVLGSIFFISQYIMSSIQTDTGHEDMNDLKDLEQAVPPPFGPVPPLLGFCVALPLR